jgi:hypothetical protein
MNREKSLGMIFATQLAPVDDTKTVDIMMTFFQDSWGHFGYCDGRRLSIEYADLPYIWHRFVMIENDDQLRR